MKERAEVTSFQNDMFDLITCAQAVHWLDFVPFYEEVRRTVKNKGLLAIWGYGLLKIGNSFDDIIHHFYQELIGPYWNEERKHIDSKYETIAFDFKEIKLSKQFYIENDMNLFELEGYFNSWSSVQNYIQSNHENPVNDLITKLKESWGNTNSTKKVIFPIFTKIGRIKK